MSTAKVVLVTGCSSGGIGFHLCEQFAARGCRVYATGRRLESMKGFEPPPVETLLLDVTKDDHVQDVVQHILDKEGKIDILVNNAGCLGIGPMAEMSMEDVQRVFDINTFSVLRLSRAVFPSMAQRESGLILTIGSVSGEITSPWNGLYCAAKAAVHSIMEALWMECKPFNVDVMLVSPASVRSNIAVNSAAVFQLRPDSLYGAHVENMVRRMRMSQGTDSMPTDVFARRIVSRALAPHPPRYLTEGGQSFLFSLLKMLPRSWVLWWLWRRLSQQV